jgi:hypothetical protein
LNFGGNQSLHQCYQDIYYKFLGDFYIRWSFYDKY